MHIMHIILHIIWHIIYHILHIHNITYSADYILYIFCIFCIWIMKKSLPLVFHFLLGQCLLLGPPWQGPAVHIPPPTSVTAALCLITTCARKVSRFPSHLEGDRSSIAHRDQRKPPQYGGNWNNIQDLSWFAALVDDGWLAGIHPSCKPSDLNIQNMQNMQNMQSMILMYKMQNM